MMTTRKRISTFIFVRPIALAAVLSGCAVVDTDSSVAPSPTAEPTPVFSNEVYAAALRSASLKLRGKLPETSELSSVLASGADAYVPLIEEYLDPSRTPELRSQMRGFYRGMFVMGNLGADGVDYDEVPNLATMLFEKDRSWAEILSSQACFGADLEPTFCQNTVPSNLRAGVLTSKPFLKKYGSAAKLNFRRSNVVHQIFACGNYPDGLDVTPWKRTNVPASSWPMNPGPKLDDPTDDYPDPSLVPSADDAMSPRRVHKKYQGAQAGVGACQGCHGTTMPRRLAFTPFTPDGEYEPARTIADVEAPEFNKDEIYCAVDPGSADCNAGGPEYNGVQVGDVRGMAQEILAEPRFYDCATTRHYDFALGKSQGSLGLAAAGGTPPTILPAATLSKYKLVFSSSGWSTRALLLEIFKGHEFLSAQAAQNSAR